MRHEAADLSGTNPGNIWKTQLMSFEHIERIRTLDTYAEEHVCIVVLGRIKINTYII